MICPKCGAAMQDNTASCPYCGYTASPVQANPNPQAQQYQPAYQNPVAVQKENVLMGTVGAVLGSLLGALSIILFYMMEMVASLSGVIMAFCTLKGYELLGKKMSTKGIIICVVIMILVTLVAFHCGLAISVGKEMGIDDFGQSLEYLDLALEFEEVKSAYMKDLAMLYLFSAIGAVGIIVSKAKNK